MSKQAAAVLAFGIAGGIITCAFVAAFYFSHGGLWVLASLISACFTLGSLYDIANSAESKPADKKSDPKQQ